MLKRCQPCGDGRAYQGALSLCPTCARPLEPWTAEQPGRAGVCTDTGLVRQANEDQFAIVEFDLAAGAGALPCGLYVVADGMGGEAGGVVASRITAELVAQQMIAAFDGLGFESLQAAPSELVQGWMQGAINRACEAVHRQARAEPYLARMGSTVVVAFALMGRLYVANVGDSRAYLITARGIEQLTVDHTLVALLVAGGVIERSAARTHPARGQLTNNVGAYPFAEAHLVERERREGDIVLLCSDGLTDMLGDQEIWEIASTCTSPAEGCQRLVDLANGRGGLDNSTVVMTAPFGGRA